ncbi:MAG: DNA-binding response regulator [Chloroflexi bacterium RBG_16_70_13]|nr:MAG: DNA-binding response regulator [Chloroflexi bacterium RBG_16_70_13]
MSGALRILLAEDHGLVRAGIRRLLDDVAGFEVVAEAGDGREALELIGRHLPDVVLLDIIMPGLNGLNTVARISVEYPSVRVIMLSMHDNEDYVWQALQAGAAGYVLKDAGVAELELAIRSVARGGSYLSPTVSRHVVRDYVRRGAAERGPSERLTARQREIAQLIAEGHTNQEMARIIGVSTKTVETHRAQLMARLEVHDVAGVVRYALLKGLVSADS